MSPADKRSSLGASVALLAASLVMTGVLIAGIEGTLRLVRVGDPDLSTSSRLKYQQIYLPILVTATRPDGTVVLRPVDKRLPYEAILGQKPANAVRVFIFGESAVAGLGFSPNVTFARELERMLRLAYRDRTVDVVNLGIVALSSKQVKLLVADVCRNYDPDLAVVYVGNNEFLELHAEKFAEAHAPWFSRLEDPLLDTNLYRVVNRFVQGEPRIPSLVDQVFSEADLRVTQDTIIKDIKVRPDEIENVLNRYKAHVDDIARVAEETKTPLILMTVASNWKWRGRDDLPAGWLDELVGPDGWEPRQARYQRAMETLSEKIEESAPAERYDWRYRRAVAEEEFGDFDAARADYRAAMNEDPHLRRALDAGNDRVRRVAQAHAVTLVDTVELLGRHERNGIVGFDEFYDYVHFTPRGAILVAAELFRTMEQMGIVPRAAMDFDLDAYVSQRLAQLERLQEDPLSVDDWLGVGFNPTSQIKDRDLWKYDRMVKDLGARIQDDPRDVRALVYRGNAYYFRLDGTEQAERDWRAALAVGADGAVRENLARLTAEARP